MQEKDLFRCGVPTELVTFLSSGNNWFPDEPTTDEILGGYEVWG
jgi:hypothetical protein